MILFDSCVWVDYLRGVATPQADKLEALLGVVPLATGDPILTDVLQRCATDREFNAVKRTLATVDFIVLGGDDVATEAARNFPKLRALGFTVPKTLDAMIATRYVVSDYELLPADRDFDSFEQHLGRRRVACEAWPFDQRSNVVPAQTQTEPNSICVKYSRRSNSSWW